MRRPFTKVSVFALTLIDIEHYMVYDNIYLWPSGYAWSGMNEGPNLKAKLCSGLIWECIFLLHSELKLEAKDIIEAKYVV